jgi:hypothetical protein
MTAMKEKCIFLMHPFQRVKLKIKTFYKLQKILFTQCKFGMLGRTVLSSSHLHSTLPH